MEKLCSIIIRNIPASVRRELRSAAALEETYEHSNRRTDCQVSCRKGKMNHGRLFLPVLVQDDVDPEIQGPFVTEAERNEAAREYRAEGFDGGIFPMEITSSEEPVTVSTDAYSGEFFEEVEP